MLVMNFSEKRVDEDLTGKFGLGFKSVHVLSDSVGIASGFIALRTLGGFLPEAWPDGLTEVELRKQGDGRKATIIDVPFTAETAEDGEEAASAFRAGMTWLPAFARSIKRIEITDIDPVNIECGVSPLLGDDSIDVVLLHGTRRQRALRFNLGDRYGLLLKIDAAGPEAFSEDLRRLWNLAPLEEDLHSGWLLNGPFAVDPGRGRLSGSIASRQDTFRRLGRKLGERLLRLHDLAGGDWTSFAATLDLDTSESIAQSLSGLGSSMSLAGISTMISHSTFTLTGMVMGASPLNGRWFPHTCRSHLMVLFVHPKSIISPMMRLPKKPFWRRCGIGRRCPACKAVSSLRM